MSEKVNVCLICGDSRDRLTEQCLYSLRQNTPSELYRLTVIANGIEPHTRDILDRYECEYEWHSLPLGGGAVTNKLIEAARRDQKEFIYHSATDFYFREGWLEALLANWPVAEACGIGVLGAYSHPYHNTVSVIPGVGGYDIHSKQMVSGGSWFMRWSTWDKFGPLNELHHGNWIGSEDSEMNFRWIAAGVGRATLVPELCIHTGRTASNGQPTLGSECMPDIEGVLIE